MTNSFSRWLSCATLVAWSGILLHFYFSGRIASFLHPMFRPFVLISGIVMLLLAIGLVFSPGVADGCCDEEGCAHAFGRMTAGRITTFLILLLPICAASAVSTDGFGARTMMNRGVVTDASGLKSAPKNQSEFPLPTGDGTAPSPPEPTVTPTPVVYAGKAENASEEYLPKSKSGAIIVQVPDLLYAAEDSSLRPDFQGKSIELIGQLMPDNVNNAKGSRFKLVRMLMVCCAADARPVAVLVEEGKKTKIPEMSWVRVTGHATFPTEGGRLIAVVKADQVVVTDPPEETMLY